jgi:hypothetical protein
MKIYDIKSQKTFLIFGNTAIRISVLRCVLYQMLINKFWSGRTYAKQSLVRRHVGVSISLLISVFSIRSSTAFFERYNRLKSPRSRFLFLKRIRITAVVTDVALFKHAETITRYRFLPLNIALFFSTCFSSPFRMIWILSLFGKGLFPSSHPPTLDFHHSRTHRLWALFTKDSFLAVVLMPFQAICTFVASFPIPPPAPIPPPPDTHHRSYFTLVSLQFLHRQSWMSFLFLRKEYFGRNEHPRHNSFLLYGHTWHS